MSVLSPAQKVALKNNIATNVNTITLVNNSVVAINTLTANDSPDNLQRVADWYNQLANPAFYVWRTSLSEAQIYDNVDTEGNTWNWTTYKNQSVTEQGAWNKIFMGGNTNFSHLNNRVGCGSIFSGSAPANAQRNHILSVGKRQCSNLEALFSTPITNAPANTGNDNIVGNQGKASNPNMPVFEGSITGNDVYEALLS